MIKFNSLTLVLFFFMLFSCKMNTDNSEEKKEKINYELMIKSALERAPEWYDLVIGANFEYEDKYFERLEIDYNQIAGPYLDFLLFNSPSGVKAVDIYSTSYIIEVEGIDTTLMAADPDVSIRYLDYDKRLVSTLNSFGSTTFLQYVLWIEEDQFIVLGVEEDYQDESLFKPVILFYDISTSVEEIYILESREIEFNKIPSPVVKYLD